MIFFPAIDLLGGKVVRLRRGQRSAVDVYSDDPLKVAHDFVVAGATWVHVVDLSATFEEDDAALSANDEAIRAICTVEGLSVDIGGGVRTRERIEELVNLGAKRIAMGTALVTDRRFARESAAEFGDVLVADIAATGGVVRVNGWREEACYAAEDLAGDLAAMGFKHLVFTDITRDGMQTGVDTKVYKSMAKACGFPVVASGGIASVDDIKALAALGPDVIEGCIAGRALYEGSFTLEEALAAAQSA
ncbi:MAG: 1-(5-phosphoribosyl)-5-[Atopobiaceae bacterium]|nr:1-(5-phosphoribosyl)-5-[(5-phosphoribosylamino)methylideneamino] imidazole-4-carboxamide isomerase [Atopobiaceae bacterium]